MSEKAYQEPMGGVADLDALIDTAPLLLPIPESTGDGPNDEAVAMHPEVRRLSDVRPERVEWLWRGRIPFAKLTMGDGDPDLGKSTFTLDLAARVSRGEAMPDGSPGLSEPGASLFLAAEDGIADTILPRFLAAGGNPDLVGVLESIQTETGERPPNLVADLARIEHHVRELQARLLVIDPLMAFLTGADARSGQDMAEALAGLKGVLERTGCAGLALRHLSKSGGGKAIYRGSYSIQISASARSVLYFARDPDDETRTVLAVAKGNLAPPADRISLAFRIEGTQIDDPEGGAPISASRLVWDGPVELTADDLAQASQDRTSPKLSAAIGALGELLADGPMESQRAWERLEAAGVSSQMVKAAKRKLGVQSVKAAFSGKWWLATPEQAAELARIGSRTQ